jgi:hypothetical protein
MKSRDSRVFFGSTTRDDGWTEPCYSKYYRIYFYIYGTEFTVCMYSVQYQCYGSRIMLMQLRFWLRKRKMMQLRINSAWFKKLIDFERFRLYQSNYAAPYGSGPDFCSCLFTNSHGASILEKNKIKLYGAFEKIKIKTFWGDGWFMLR